MSLRLVITQGPQQGQTLEFAPGSTVRIGRVVRGNSLAIKDSGVSSKHLSIQSEKGKWLLQDLESSNGTFLNGDTIDSGAGVELRDGDCVKIGEATSISVAIGGEAESLVRRRNPRRCTAVEKSAAEEDSEPVRRVGRLKKSVVSEVPLEVEKKPARQVNTRQRNRRLINSDVTVLEVIPENSSVDVEDSKVPAKPTRRARAKKGKDVPKNSVVDVPEERDSEIGARVEKNDACDGIEEVGGSVSKEVDLEAMTLGQWLDFLEVDLPKQIIEATEEMIDGMRLKARRVCEYAMEQKKGKGIAL